MGGNEMIATRKVMVEEAEAAWAQARATVRATKAAWEAALVVEDAVRTWVEAVWAAEREE